MERAHNRLGQNLPTSWILYSGFSAFIPSLLPPSPFSAIGFASAVSLSTVLASMSDLSDLYQSVILDHNRRPRNRGKLPNATRVASGDNPTCGDNCTVYLRLDGEKIGEITFEGSGCAISQASASLMTTQLKGKTASEAAEIFKDF